MKTNLVSLALCLASGVAWAQTPEPGVILYLIADGVAPNKPAGVYRVLSPTEITCGLPNSNPPAGASASSFYVTWADPLGTGSTFCQADMTKDVQTLSPGNWYASLTFVLPAAMWGTGPCPTDGCPPLTLVGKPYPVFYIAGHETPAFAVGTFVRPPTSLMLKAE